MLTAQQIFDRVADHLAKQGVAAYRRDAAGIRSCVYKNDQGQMCAVGCLIPEQSYRPEFDDRSLMETIWEQHRERFAEHLLSAPGTDARELMHYTPFAEALAAGGVDVHEHHTLLTRLQRVHDISMTHGYTAYAAHSLRVVAMDHGLSDSAVSLSTKEATQ